MAWYRISITPFLLCTVAMVSLFLPCQSRAQQTQQRVLTGGVSQTHWEETAPSNTCTICAASTVVFTELTTGQPIQQAIVDIPDWGYQGQTDAQGRIGIPRDVMRTTPAHQRLIGNIQQTGVLPESFLLDPTPLLQGRAVVFAAPRRLYAKTQQLVLDNVPHHLGDGDFVSRSSGATGFQRSAEGPLYANIFQFAAQPNRPITLHIGAITGLDTPQAHANEGTSVNTYGSPVQVWLNQVRVGEIVRNGQNVSLPLPAKAFSKNGQQLLRIVAGQNRLKTDVDDMEFRTLWISVD